MWSFAPECAGAEQACCAVRGGVQGGSGGTFDAPARNSAGVHVGRLTPYWPSERKAGLHNLSQVGEIVIAIRRQINPLQILEHRGNRINSR